MPKFTITKNGEVIESLTFDGERIELGSSATCALNIDDLEVALKQAAFVREDEGGRYRIEPLMPIPVMKLADTAITEPIVLDHGAIIHIESYQVKIEYEPAAAPAASAESPPPALAPLPPLSPDPAPPAPVIKDSAPTGPAIPPPLVPQAPSSPKTDPRATPPSLPQGGGADEDRTVYVRTVGKLVAIQGPLKGQQWDLISGETRIGRDRSWSRIVIREDDQGKPDTSISRRHATIHVIGDKVFVEDQKSTAGTFVDGRQVPAGQKLEVADRGTIEIRSSKESTILRLELLQTSGASAPPAPIAPIAPAVPESLPGLSPPLPPPAPSFKPPDYVRNDAPAFDSILSESSEGGGAGDSYQDSRREVREDSGYVPLEDNPFAPDSSGRGGGSWPKWIWVVIVVAVIIVAGIVFLAMR